jgi:hypothetical protein
MLAYVFWHWPRPALDPGHYVDALLAFHRSLEADPPPGFRGSRVREVEGAPWVPVPRAIEDWYLVDDFAALGALEQAAVAGHRLEPHDRAARLALGGAGGLYGRLRGAIGADPGHVVWFGKPASVRYPEFLAGVPAGELWQRKLVLGPAPEFCLGSAAAPPGADGPITVRARLLHSTA